MFLQNTFLHVNHSVSQFECVSLIFFFKLLKNHCITSQRTTKKNFACGNPSAHRTSNKNVFWYWVKTLARVSTLKTISYTSKANKTTKKWFFCFVSYILCCCNTNKFKAMQFRYEIGHRFSEISNKKQLNIEWAKETRNRVWQVVRFKSQLKIIQKSNFEE